MRLETNQNPYSPPLVSSPDDAFPTIWNRFFVASAIAGVVLSSLCLYLVLTHPVVRPPDWNGGMRFRVLTGIAKWGSLATIILGCISYIKSPKSWLDKIYLAIAMSPAAVVIGLYLCWLFLFA